MNGVMRRRMKVEVGIVEEALGEMEGFFYDSFIRFVLKWSKGRVFELKGCLEYLKLWMRMHNR